MKKGLLLINLGTPKKATYFFVLYYLYEFLTDKKVIDLPFLLRYLLVIGFILPFRTKKTLAAYKAIWKNEGAPLRIYSQALKKSLEKELGKEWQVALGMRYGQPSLKKALADLSDCSELTILPLYPQYAEATTGSSFKKVTQLLKKIAFKGPLHLIPYFYTEPHFIAAQASLIQPHLSSHEFFLFSYHGLPEHQVKKTGCTELCIGPCTLSQAESKKDCYRFQCHATSKACADHLGLKASQYHTVFQSRLGSLPWIKPYLDSYLIELSQSGIKRLAIICPSFIVDCLETLEEVGIRAKAQWLSLGGEQLTLVPCINASPTFVKGFSPFLSQILLKNTN